MLTSLSLIVLVGLSLGAICGKCKIPCIIGMLFTGIVLEPFVPASFEIIGYIVLAPVLLGISIDSIMEGEFMTFKTQFKKTYGELLIPLGYKYCSKLNYFIKAVNEEIYTFVGYRGEPAWNKGDKAFTIVAGAFTVYLETINKEYISTNEVELINYCHNKKYGMGFVYNMDSMEKMIGESVEEVKKILNILETIIDADSLIQYGKKYNIDLIRRSHEFRGDSLIFILADNHDDFKEYFSELCNQEYMKIENGDVGKGYTKELAYSGLYQGIMVDVIQSRDKVFNDPDLYKKAMEEANRRKEQNLKILRELKVI